MNENWRIIFIFALGVLKKLRSNLKVKITSFCVICAIVDLSIVMYLAFN